jgi:cytochrome c-type biogenesis protein CcmH/NrfG
VTTSLPAARVLAQVERGFDALGRRDYVGAKEAARRLLTEDAQQVDALYLSGLIAMTEDDFVAAEDFWERAILAKRDFPDPWVALLELLQRQDRKDDFDAVYELAREAAGHRSETRGQLANLLIAHDAERAFAELDDLYRSGETGLPVAASRLRALVALGRAREAAEDARRALEARPDGLDETALLGITLIESEEFEAASKVLADAVARHPEKYAFNFDLCLGLHRSGDDRSFDRYMAGLLERFPDDPQAMFLLAFRDLAAGRFGRGFARYESRKRLPGAHVIRSAPIPEWRGEAIEGERLLVYDEQGYGDNLMFARFLPRLLEQGMEVTVVAPEALYALFAAQPTLRRARVVKRLVTAQWDQGDRWVSLMSLPHVLGIEHPVHDVRFPYLEAQQALMDHWGARVGDVAGLKVGLAWAANPRQSVGRERSLGWEQLSPLLAVPGVRFFSLQVGPGRLHGSRPGIEDLAPELFDFADTFAVVSQLDLVITVDTSVAHVAGALGRPCWVMTPFLTDWRFSADEDGSAWWYPATRVFRQARRGDWGTVVARVRDELRAATTGGKLLP